MKRAFQFMLVLVLTFGFLPSLVVAQEDITLDKKWSRVTIDPSTATNIISDYKYIPGFPFIRNMTLVKQMF